ncbi:MAG: hypothetical protein ACP5U0_09315 [Caldisphaera sp.]
MNNKNSGKMSPFLCHDPNYFYATLAKAPHMGLKTKSRKRQYKNE